MIVSQDEFKRIGQKEEACNGLGFSDSELTLAIKAKRLVIAYLEGRGTRWQLAATPLRIELYQLEDYVEARRRDKIEPPTS